MADAFEHYLLLEHEQSGTNAQKIAKAEEAIAAILADASEEQRAYILDDREYVSARCPRRSGKTWANTAKALVQQLRYPGSRIIIISLTLKSTRENYWARGPAGLFAFNKKYNLGITFNHTDSVWTLPNGSTGRLAGAETRADIEYLRGAAAEAHGALVDECKSFAPQHLQELLEDVLEPGLMTYNGWMALTGTPGFIPMGPFYEATQPYVTNAQKVVTCVPHKDWQEYLDKQAAQYLAEHDEEDPVVVEPWSFHYWNIQDNDRIKNPKTGQPTQWLRALKVKKNRGWDDNHPTWRREYLGEWGTGNDGMVYTFLQEKTKNPEKVTWLPSYDPETRKLQYPSEGPWHIVMGLDLGFEDDTALVIAAYSEVTNTLLHIHSEKHKHLIIPDVVAILEAAIAKYGNPAFIVADMGAQGKQIVETIIQQYGIPIERAIKADKNDYIELLNSDFSTGHVKIIQGSELDYELCGLQWALGDKDKALLARTNRLKEDPNCPNHLCDALLYLWRFSYHHYGRAIETGPEPGTPEWYAQQEAEIERKIAFKKRVEGYTTDNLLRGNKPVTRDTLWRLKN